MKVKRIKLGCVISVLSLTLNELSQLPDVNNSVKMCVQGVCVLLSTLGSHHWAVSVVEGF